MVRADVVHYKRPKPILMNAAPMAVVWEPVKRKRLHVSFRDEEGDTNKKDFKDPAIISAISGGITTELPPAGGLVEHRYSKDELLKLRKAPQAQKKPKCLDAAYFNASGVWDPEPWHYSNKQAEQAENHGEDGVAPSGGKQRSRPSDPRERIRKEQDGIVLSPQRRNFNLGCFVPNSKENANATVAPGPQLPMRANRTLSPLGGAAGNGKGDRDRDRERDRDQPMQRRIGSGRILPWDYQEKTEENDFGYRREIGGDRDRDRGDRDRSDRDRNDRRDRSERGGGDRRIDDRDRDDRFERRSFGRDFDPSSNSSKHRNSTQGRNFNRRISNESKEEEPEWFSSGPTSQNDTIELRGFEDLPEKLSKKINNKNKRSIANGDAGKKDKDSLLSQKNPKESLIGKEIGTSSGGRGSPAKEKKDEKTKGKESKEGGQEKEKLGGGDEECFNFDAMFKADSLPIPGLLSNGVESGDAAGSRFSRWFQREKSPPTKENSANNGSGDSKRVSPHDQEHHHQLIRNLLGDTFNEPQTVSIPQPGDSESYFAPISPAANTQLPQAGRAPHKQPECSLNMIEMHQRAAAAAAAAGHMGHAGKKADPPPGSGKILSLEELEGPLRQGAHDKGGQNKTSEEDMQQFKRLFSQMEQKPMSIMEMLSHSQQKDAEASRIHHHHQQRMPPQQPPPQQVPPMADMAFKLHQLQNQVHRQQQLEMLNKLFNANASGGNTFGCQPHRASPLHDIGLAPNRELLNRPEAHAILQGLKRGDITPQHLYQQLANPAMQPRHREMLLAILKMQQTASQPQVLPTLQGVVNVNVVQQQQVVPPPPAAVSPNFYTQQQLRVSPLTPNAYCVSPIMATSPNTLSVPAIHQRIPSPRELQVHTQNIMQRALIKKKLEEQEEKYHRMKLQQQQRGATSSPAKSTASPTLFMPTSVMRKLTADKEDSSKDGKDKLPQGRPLTGLRCGQQGSPNPQGNMQMSSQQQHQWNAFAAHMKQPGRPIVKANKYQQGQNQAEYFQQQQAQQAQQHRLMHQAHLPQQPSQQQHSQKQFYNHHQQSQQGQQFQQLNSQQLRQQHQNVRAQHQQQQPPAFQHSQAANWGGQTAGFDSNHHRGDLSPTSDQLAKWFSPDLLERARKGNVPSIPTSAVAQHALSLEEIERQTTPVGQH